MGALRLLAMVHQDDAGPGVFTAAIEAGGHRLDTWKVSEETAPPADPLGYDGVLCLGGSAHPREEQRYPWLSAEKEALRQLLAAEVPLLGVCLGAQLLTIAAGGEARRTPAPEIGWVEVEVTPDGAADPLLAPLAPCFEAFEWHSYECLPPDGSTPLARNPTCLQAFRIGARAHAIQFHAEVSGVDARHWIDDYRADPDAVRTGVDPAVLHADTEPRIAAFNQLGRDLCGRWLDLVGG
jgi:GMP synthase-like glutamine amidotransferase